jgi:hypothetical protein
VTKEIKHKLRYSFEFPCLEIKSCPNWGEVWVAPRFWILECYIVTSNCNRSFLDCAAIIWTHRVPLFHKLNLTVCRSGFKCVPSAAFIFWWSIPFFSKAGELLHFFLKSDEAFLAAHFVDVKNPCSHAVS